jgi:F420-non-reducing hydrogenase small subunit
MFCPCLLDTKKKDIQGLPDGDITLTLFNGAIRTDENLEMAKLLRKKSKLLVAMGACSASGGIPALANLSTRAEVMAAAYLDSPSVDNPKALLPQERTTVPEGELELPRFFDRVLCLSNVVPVDYTIPGCPPESEQLWNVLQVVIQALFHGSPLPPAKSVIGATKSSVCDECGRERTDKKIRGFRRVWEFVPDPKQCLLEQGLVCMGIATRGGCGALCPEVGMPCIGCYGTPDGVFHQGAKLASTLGAIIDIAPIRDQRNLDAINTTVDDVVASAPDLAGTAGKFTLAEHHLGSDHPNREPRKP